jgi:hypothetical protein
MDLSGAKLGTTPWVIIIFDLLLKIASLSSGEDHSQFFFESRLHDEAQPVADVHFTPGASLGVIGGIGFLF